MTVNNHYRNEYLDTHPEGQVQIMPGQVNFSGCLPDSASEFGSRCTPLMAVDGDYMDKDNDDDNNNNSYVILQLSVKS